MDIDVNPYLWVFLINLLWLAVKAAMVTAITFYSVSYCVKRFECWRKHFVCIALRFNRPVLNKILTREDFENIFNNFAESISDLEDSEPISSLKAAAVYDLFQLINEMHGGLLKKIKLYLQTKKCVGKNCWIAQGNYEFSPYAIGGFYNVITKDIFFSYHSLYLQLALHEFGHAIHAKYTKWWRTTLGHYAITGELFADASVIYFKRYLKKHLKIATLEEHTLMPLDQRVLSGCHWRCGPMSIFYDERSFADINKTICHWRREQSSMVAAAMVLLEPEFPTFEEYWQFLKKCTDRRLREKIDAILQKETFTQRAEKFIEHRKQMFN